MKHIPAGKKKRDLLTLIKQTPFTSLPLHVGALRPYGVGGGGYIVTMGVWYGVPLKYRGKNPSCLCPNSPLPRSLPGQGGEEEEEEAQEEAQPAGGNRTGGRHRGG